MSYSSFFIIWCTPPIKWSPPCRWPSFRELQTWPPLRDLQTWSGPFAGGGGGYLFGQRRGPCAPNSQTKEFSCLTGTVERTLTLELPLKHFSGTDAGQRLLKQLPPSLPSFRFISHNTAPTLEVTTNSPNTLIGSSQSKKKVSQNGYLWIPKQFQNASFK